MPLKVYMLNTRVRMIKTNPYTVSIIYNIKRKRKFIWFFITVL